MRDQRDTSLGSAHGQKNIGDTPYSYMHMSLVRISRKNFNVLTFCALIGLLLQKGQAGLQFEGSL